MFNLLVQIVGNCKQRGKTVVNAVKDSFYNKQTPKYQFLSVLNIHILDQNQFGCEVVLVSLDIEIKLFYFAVCSYSIAFQSGQKPVYQQNYTLNTVQFPATGFPIGSSTSGNV